MLTDEAIETAKALTKYSLPEGGNHEHNDCIRMAYEWLDAQIKTKSPTKKAFPLKHIIEKWAGRYVSRSDVEVAALMHPEVHGDYPFFNISTRLTEPSSSRLREIPEAFRQSEIKQSDRSPYKRRE